MPMLIVLVFDTLFLRGVMIINIISFIVIGLVAGLIVAIFFGKPRKLLWGTVGAGIIGSLVGGVLYSAFSIGKQGYEISPFSLIILFLGIFLFMGIISIIVRNKEY